MPLIILTGIPCSGKTTRCEELKNFFLEKNKEVIIVSEAEQIARSGFEKNLIYLDSNKEKHIRGLLKSEVLRYVTSTNLVILDGLNYIKGFRYELYCGTKSNKATQCTIHAEINRQESWKINDSRNETEKYTKEVYDALVLRYEEPDGNNRWDAPLFMIFPDQELDKDKIYSTLFDKEAPKPNKSTQNAPLSSTNFLYDLDQSTKKIVASIIKAKKQNLVGKVQIPEFENLYIDVSKVSIPDLSRLRRQYISYSKLNPPNSQEISSLFVQYLNTSLT
ncbi:protein KTI12 homolog [Harmonia axyridis]|uniref:protein KTI12 homolog n=1 Tax=Harmonia axyridis TaxID=115357 RepID=UPI001E2780BA|nr:protein KTI12 homolog [Harmonia axyridis]